MVKQKDLAAIVNAAGTQQMSKHFEQDPKGSIMKSIIPIVGG
jgi:hypothetical protein